MSPATNATGARRETGACEILFRLLEPMEDYSPSGIRSLSNAITAAAVVLQAPTGSRLVLWRKGSTGPRDAGR